jgi:hypothetical protein
MDAHSKTTYGRCRFSFPELTLEADRENRIEVCPTPRKIAMPGENRKVGIHANSAQSLVTCYPAG